MFNLPQEQLEPTLSDISRRLHAEFGACEVYLFGSRAGGQASPRSDIDLVVVVANSSEDTALLAGRAYRALGPINAPKDILVYTRAQFAERSSWPGSFESGVVKRGRLLHAA